MVEQRTENPRVAGSIPALGIFVAKSNEIIEYGRVAQLVEHLTFNQVVRGSNPRTLIVEQAILLVFFVILTYILITLVVYFDYTYAMQKIQHRHNM